MRGIIITIALGALVVGCTSDPIETDEVSAMVSSCCAASKARIAAVKDIETDDFRDRCNACRRGKSKAGCAKAARNLDATIKRAYGDYTMPLECTQMLTTLKSAGIE